MAARRLAVAGGSAVASLGTVLCLRDKDVKGKLLRKEFERETIMDNDLFYYTSFEDGDDGRPLLTAAEKLLEETGEEMKVSSHQFRSSTDSALEDAKVRAIVAGRFVDLLARSTAAVLDYKISAMLGKTDEKSMSEIHRRHAKSLHDACAFHGGLLVKLGQYLATNTSGIIPPEYKAALRPLQSRCNSIPVEEVCSVIEQELRKLYGNKEDNLIEKVFLQIDTEPLGSASLAQVHAATLRDGRRVALKVQRPNLDVCTKADMIALQVLSKVVEKVFPGLGFQWMLPEFHETISAELDFTQEAQNAERCKKMIGGSALSIDTSIFSIFLNSWTSMFDLRQKRSPRAIVPSYLPDLTTSRLLTMSFEEGFRITDVERLRAHGIDPRHVAASSCSLFAELMFVHGFVYADAHPGNVLVRPRLKRGEFDLVLLDHGMYRRLDERFRSGFCHLWAGLVNGDDDQAMKGMKIIGLGEKYFDVMGLLLTYRLPASLIGPDSPLRHQKLGQYFTKESRAAIKEYLWVKYGVNMVSAASFNQVMESQSRDFLYCYRCTNLVRGMNKELGGSTLERFVAFGSAAMRGTNLHCDAALTPAVSKTEARGMLESQSEMLARVKASLNRPVASELLAHDNDDNGDLKDSWNSTLFPFTQSDMIDAYHVAFRTWWRGLLLEAVLAWNGVKLDQPPGRKVG